MSRRALTVELVVALLLMFAAVLVYLEWWRSGELELLNRRADELELELARVAAKTNGGARKRAPRKPATEGTT